MTNSGHNPVPSHSDDCGNTTVSNSCDIVQGDRIEWSRNTILEFIEDYRNYRVLWDPNTKGYHIKQIKYEALKTLSRKYGTEVRIVRSKIKSLRSSFHREHGKVISGKRRGINYQPMWFAYEAIRFILDEERDDTERGYLTLSTTVKADSDTITNATAALVVGAPDMAPLGGLGQLVDRVNDPHCAHICAEDVKTEIVETSHGGADDLKTTIRYESSSKSSSKKRKRQTSKGQSVEDLESFYQERVNDESCLNDDMHDHPRKTVRHINPLNSTPDEFGVFGEYVGLTIRRLRTSKAQVVIKHLINNLLYDAEMGRYDYGIPTSRDPPHLYATLD